MILPAPYEGGRESYIACHDGNLKFKGPPYVLQPYCRTVVLPPCSAPLTIYLGWPIERGSSLITNVDQCHVS